MQSANFSGDPFLAWAALSVANANRDGTTGTYVLITTGIKGGRRVNGVRITPLGNTAAGMIRFFLKPPGGSLEFYHEVEVLANVPTATAPVQPIDVDFPRGLNLPLNWELHASTQNGETFNVFADGGDYASTTVPVVNT
jgi:hypothetical protein